MKWRDWLEQWGMTSLRIKLGVLDTEWKPQDPDRNAAWEMYVELLTRITTQPLPRQSGDDEAALTSVYSLFATTRELLRRQGRGAMEFAKLALVILNQKVRPEAARRTGKSQRRVSPRVGRSAGRVEGLCANARPNGGRRRGPHGY